MAVSSSCFARAYFAGNVGLVSVSDAAVTDPELTAMGLTNVEVAFDTGVGLSLAAGSSVSDVIRIEGEFSYRKNDMDTLSASMGVNSATIPVNGEIESMGLMGNVFADINTDSATTPFLGLGIGFSNFDAEIEGDSEDDTVFVYQFILGA